MADMTDRELLEMAAKAAGIEFSWINNDGARLDRKPGVMQPYVRWNPLNDDGDALRLAVKLGISVSIDLENRISVVDDLVIFYDEAKFGGDCDPYAATRRGIVRAAAEIGKEMP